MTQMMTEGAPPTAHTVPPGQPWAQPDQQWTSPEQQWTDWGRTQSAGGGPKAPRGFRPALLIPLGVLAALIVIGGIFLMFADPAGAAALCGGM